MKKECIICGFDKRVHKHHIVKRRELGSDDEENLVFLCPNHHWVADFGNEEERKWMLQQIKDITGKIGVKISKEDEKLLFKKAKRIVEETLGRYSEEEWKKNNMENSFNFLSTIDLLRGRRGWSDNFSYEANKRSELLLIRDEIDKELGYSFKEKHPLDKFGF